MLYEVEPASGYLPMWVEQSIAKLILEKENKNSPEKTNQTSRKLTPWTV